MTRKEWDDRCTLRIAKYMATYPGRGAAAAIRWANDTMVKDYGLRPEPENKPQSDEARAPWWLRIGVGLAGGDMANVLKVVLRFGPLVAAAALGLGAVLEPIVPGYTGIVTQVLSFLGVVGIGPDQDVVANIAAFVAGITALVGVVRKTWSLIQPKYFPKK